MLSGAPSSLSKRSAYLSYHCFVIQFTSYIRQIGAAFASRTIKSVAIPAAFVLKRNGALQFEWRELLHNSNRYRFATPRVHLR